MRKDRSKARGYDPELWKTRHDLVREINEVEADMAKHAYDTENYYDDELHVARLRATLADWDEREHANKKATDVKQETIGGCVRGIIMLSYHVGDYYENGTEEQLKKCLKSIRGSARYIAQLVNEPLEKEYAELD